MKVPICIFDAKTGVLCPKCESRLKSGEFSQSDVDSSIKLIKLSHKNQDIDKLTLISCQKIDGDYILFLKDSNITHIKSNNKLINSVEKEFNGKVWFVEADSSPRRFLENLFFPERILKTKMIWLPDGNQVMQVGVKSNNYEKFSNTVEKIKKIVKAIRKMELVVEISK